MVILIEKKGVSYDTYKIAQGRKMNNPEKRDSFIETIPKRIKRFRNIFSEIKDQFNPGKILCLGARTGCEVQAARDLGFKDSIGIDLHPAFDDSDLVILGDWQAIPFQKDSFENVFTNAIDHCYDVEQLAKEVNRVLITGGIFCFMVSKKQMLVNKSNPEEYMKKSNNFLFWKTPTDVSNHFTKFGFVLEMITEQGHWNTYIMRKQ